MTDPQCAVQGCDQASVHDVAVPGGRPFGVCAGHHGVMAREPWAFDGVHGEILVGAALAARGLLAVDHLGLRSGSYAPGQGAFTTLTVSGRVLGSGEPRGVDVVLTDDVVRQLAKLVWMYQRHR